MEKMSGQLTKIDELAGLLSVQVTGIAGQATEIDAHLNRATRMQYRTGQETQEKLEHLSAGMDTVRQWQTSHDIDTARLDDLERQNNFLTEALMRWLDDIDHVHARLLGGEWETWRQLLERWAGQLLQTLADIGIYEINVLGAAFDPQWAESIGVAGRDQFPLNSSESENGRAYVPYEVVEVTRRGFAFSGGRLLRKAQVITIREDAPVEQQ
jgi:molecular chaperone GrpE (heat shock protein)